MTQINAKITGTAGVRNPGNTRPDDTASSSSSDESLTSNAPTVLVRGCHQVRLDAVTTPSNQPVTWSANPNQNSGTAPTLTPTNGGKSATLSTDQTGSFSVIAELDGTKVVWNVVFAWVKVDVSTYAPTARKNFADAGSGGGACAFRSGQFSAGNYAWEGTVKLQVIGGGNDGKLGIDKVKVKILQNGVRDDLTGNYDGGGTAVEVPVGGLPIVDSNDGTQPFVYFANSASVTPATGTDRTWWTGDSPAGGFPTSHQNTHKKLLSISGANGFQTAVASVSDDAQNSIVAHAKTGWVADFSGSVSAAGTYTPTTANVNPDASMTLISDATGGQDAGDAGLETFQPRFNAGTNTTWNP